MQKKPKQRDVFISEIIKPTPYLYMVLKTFRKISPDSEIFYPLELKEIGTCCTTMSIFRQSFNIITA